MNRFRKIALCYRLPIETWTGGERSRPLQAVRSPPCTCSEHPCICGASARGTSRGVGYLTASGPDGCGATAWISDEATFQAIEADVSRFQKEQAEVQSEACRSSP